MSEKLTHGEFARRVSYMASFCADWSGSCLTLPEEMHKPMTAGAMQRFIDDMQKRIDYLREDLAALETPHV